MSRGRSKPSPILGLATSLIDQASETLVVAGSRFRHSFEAEVGQIDPNPDQPRRVFDRDSLVALAATMRDAGQLHPILVQRAATDGRRWTIVAGERRWRAAQLNGWATILAIELDGDPEVASLLENLQRVDLAPHEEAQALHRLISSKGWSQDQAANVLGRSKGEVSATLRILSLPKDILEVLTSEHPVPRNVLVELARLDDLPSRDRLLGLAREGALTVRAIRSEKERSMQAVKPEPLDRHKRPFSYRSVETLASHLQRLHVQGVVPTSAEQARLVALRQTISDILGDGVGDWPRKPTASDH